ncbi:DUF5979 domain-containing protein, partial [Hydromonas duriensis]
MKKTLRFFIAVIFAVCTILPFRAFPAATNVQFSVDSDGESPFDANDFAGNDSSAANGLVRSNDTLTYRVNYLATNTDVLKFVFTLPVGTSWDSSSVASTVCNGSGGGVISGQVLTCYRLPSVGAESFVIKAASQTLPNGTVITPTFKVDNGSVVNGPSTTVSALPKATTRIYANGSAPLTLNGVAGYSANMNVGIGLDGSTKVLALKGAEPIAAGTTFKISVQPGAILTSTCASPWQCSQPNGAGTPIQVTVTQQINFSAVTDAVTSFSPSPHWTALQQNFSVFTPIDPNNTPSNTADDNFPLGSNSYFSNQILEFDPSGVSGLSNFGSGYAPQTEPGFSCNSSVNNQYACSVKPVDRTNTIITVSPNYSVVSQQNSIFNPIYADGNLYTNAPYPYSEAVLPGERFMATSGFFNEAKSPSSVSEAGMCFAFDNTKLVLDGTPSVGWGANSVNVWWSNTPVTGSDLILEYSSQPYGSDADRKAIDCGVAGDNASGWVTDPSQLSGGVGSVNTIRFKYANGKVLDPANGLAISVPLQRLFDANSLTVTDGTLVPWFTSYNYRDPNTSKVVKRLSTYNAANGELGLLGGRINTQQVFVRHNTSLGASSVAPGSSVPITMTPLLVGPNAAGLDALAKNVSLKVSFPDNCLSPVSTSLPVGSTYTPGNFGADGIACTADDGAAGSVTIPIGDQTALGGSANAPYPGHLTSLSPITFSVLAASNASVAVRTLTTVISADNDFSTAYDNTDRDRTNSVALNVNGVAAFSASKSTTGVTGGKVGPNEVFGYTINFGNGGASDSGVATFVDVLPFDGDDNGTSNLGSGKLEVVGLSAAMTTSAMGTVAIEYSTDNPMTIQNAVKVSGQEDGNVGITWMPYTAGSAVPNGITAVRFITSTPMLIGHSGYGAISVKAPTINSTTSVTNSIWARTTLYNGNPASVQVIRSGSPVTIQGLDAATLRGRVFIDTNANGTYEVNESGLAGTLVKIECTGGACLSAPQGTVFSMLVDSAGGYSFAPNATGIFPSADGTGTEVTGFQGAVAGTWTITEIPTGTPQTAISTTSVGTVAGVTSGTAAGRSITGVNMVGGQTGINYNFAERFLDGTIEVTKALTLPTGITGPLSFTFTATCDLPVANTQKSATLSDFPTNTKVSITGIAAGATCTVAETLPASPDTKFFWETPVFSALSPSTMPNGGTQTVTATNKLSP